MVGLGYGMAHPANLSTAGWVHGLKLAAVAVVAHAVWGVGRKLCTDLPRVALALGGGVVLLAVPGALAQVGVIAAGGLIGWSLYCRSMPAPSHALPPSEVGHHGVAVTALVAFFVLLVGLPALAARVGMPELSVFDSFYRAGALVFGGGHVVLPLLRAEIVARGWLTDERFFAGYGAAQALPGPMFAFPAYLGAAMHPGRWSAAHGLGCVLAIFLPGWLLIGGALPFWQRLRGKRWA
jgi:chromate transporter